MAERIWFDELFVYYLVESIPGREESQERKREKKQEEKKKKGEWTGMQVVM